ncbi:hypothetical protein J6P92_09020 [bacterium]|nr:hypothetical protein [bacterium]
MKVLAISAIDYKSNLQGKTNLKQNNISNRENSYNLTTPSAYYNKITFTGKEELAAKTLPELIEYMEKTVLPFIEKNTQLYNRGQKIGTKIDKAVLDLDICVDKNKDKIVFRPFELEEFERLRLDEFHENKRVFKSLFRKSKQYYTTRETKDFAENTNNEFYQIPTFLRGVYRAFYSMKKHTEKGLKKQTLDNLNPTLGTKRNRMNEAGIKTLFGWENYYDVERIYCNFLQAEEFGVSDIDLFRIWAQKAENSIEAHNKLLPQLEKNIENAEKSYQDNMFTEEDFNLINNIPELRYRFIEENVEKFNGTASTVKLDKFRTKQLDAFLQRQRKLINSLKNRIEADKKAFFEPFHGTDRTFEDDLADALDDFIFG